MANSKSSYLNVREGYSCKLSKNSKGKYHGLDIKKPVGEAFIPLESIEDIAERGTLIKLIEEISSSGDKENKLKPQLWQLIKGYIL